MVRSIHLAFRYARGLVENEGFKYILRMLVGTNKLEKMHMSRWTLNQELISQFCTEKSRVIDEINMVKKSPLMKGRAITPGRYFAIYHDAWKSAMDVAFFALRLTAMLVGVSPWIIYQWKLTCRKFPHPHSIVQLMICPSLIPRIRSA